MQSSNARTKTQPLDGESISQRVMAAPLPKGRVTQRVIDYLDSILEVAHPADLKQDLNDVLLHYIMYHCGHLDPDFKITMQNYIMLFEWLDIVEEEMNNAGVA